MDEAIIFEVLMIEVICVDPEQIKIFKIKK